MSDNSMDKELAALYQQRKNNISAPKINVTEQGVKAKPRSVWNMLMLLVLGGSASFGIMAIVSFFAEPDVHGRAGQFKQHSVTIVELAPVTPEPVSIPVTPPLPAKPDFQAPKKLAAIATPDAQTVVAPDIQLDDTPAGDIQLPQVAVPVTTFAPSHKVMPEYPKSAVFSRQSGQVKLGYRINEQGAVVDIVTLNKKRNKALERSAKQALSQWRYPVAAASEKMHTVMFDFNLAAK